MCPEPVHWTWALQANERAAGPGGEPVFGEHGRQVDTRSGAGAPITGPSAQQTLNSLRGPGCGLEHQVKLGLLRGIGPPQGSPPPTMWGSSSLSSTSTFQPVPWCWTQMSQALGNLWPRRVTGKGKAPGRVGEGSSQRAGRQITPASSRWAAHYPVSPRAGPWVSSGPRGEQAPSHRLGGFHLASNVHLVLS